MPFQRLPLWVQLAAFMLAMNAGMVNVLSLFSLLHQSVSHMTGNVSLLADAIVHFNVDQIIFLSLIVISYVLGSSYSGLILGNSHLQLTQRYGIPLSLVALFLFLCWCQELLNGFSRVPTQRSIPTSYLFCLWSFYQDFLLNWEG